jgi:hypothetical protein
MSIERLANKYMLSTNIPASMERTVEHRYAYLVSKWTQAQAVLAMVDRSGYDTKTALAAEPEITRKLKEGAPRWAARSIISYVSPEAGLKVDGRTYRDFVLLQFDKAAAGLPHFEPSMYRRVVADGRLTEQQLIADWRRRCLTFQALIDAGEEGGYNPISHGKLDGTNGLGVATGVIIGAVVAVVLIAAIVAIAYVAAESEKTSRMNAHLQKIIDQVCYEDGKLIRSKACIEALKNAMNPDLNKTGGDQTIELAVKYGALTIGALAFVNLILNRVSTLGAK